MGEALLASAIDAARGRGARRALLAVRASNLAALRLYERFGFREIGSHESYYQDPVEDARIMLLELSREG
jgi:ribosomal-protein-alanine N-acetyltransferase